MAWLLAAVVVVLLLVRFPKFIGGILILAVGLIAVFLVTLWAGEENKKRMQAKVKLEVKYDPSACTNEFPLLVTIRNETRQTLEKVSFKISMKKPGYSSDLSNYENYSSDRIIPATSQWKSCWRIPELAYGKSLDGYETSALTYEISHYYPPSFVRD